MNEKGQKKILLTEILAIQKLFKELVTSNKQEDIFTNNIKDFLNDILMNLDNSKLKHEKLVDCSYKIFFIYHKHCFNFSLLENGKLSSFSEITKRLLRLYFTLLIELLINSSDSLSKGAMNNLISNSLKAFTSFNIISLWAGTKEGFLVNELKELQPYSKLMEHVKEINYLGFTFTEFLKNFLRQKSQPIQWTNHFLELEETFRKITRSLGELDGGEEDILFDSLEKVPGSVSGWHRVKKFNMNFYRTIEILNNMDNKNNSIIENYYHNGFFHNSFLEDAGMAKTDANKKPLYYAMEVFEMYRIVHELGISEESKISAYLIEAMNKSPIIKSESKRLGSMSLFSKEKAKQNQEDIKGLKEKKEQVFSGPSKASTPFEDDSLEYSLDTDMIPSSPSKWSISLEKELKNIHEEEGSIEVEDGINEEKTIEPGTEQKESSQVNIDGPSKKEFGKPKDEVAPTNSSPLGLIKNKGYIEKLLFGEGNSEKAFNSEYPKPFTDIHKLVNGTTKQEENLPLNTFQQNKDPNENAKEIDDKQAEILNPKGHRNIEFKLSELQSVDEKIENYLDNLDYLENYNTEWKTSLYNNMFQNTFLRNTPLENSIDNSRLGKLHDNHKSNDAFRGEKANEVPEIIMQNAQPKTQTQNFSFLEKVEKKETPLKNPKNKNSKNLKVKKQEKLMVKKIPLKKSKISDEEMELLEALDASAQKKKDNSKRAKKESVEKKRVATEILPRHSGVDFKKDSKGFFEDLNQNEMKEKENKYFVEKSMDDEITKQKTLKGLVLNEDFFEVGSQPFNLLKRKMVAHAFSQTNRDFEAIEEVISLFLEHLTAEDPIVENKETSQEDEGILGQRWNTSESEDEINSHEACEAKKNRKRKEKRLPKRIPYSTEEIEVITRWGMINGHSLRVWRALLSNQKYKKLFHGKKRTPKRLQDTFYHFYRTK